MTKTGRPSDFDYATSGAGMRKVETPKQTEERVRREMMQKAGVLDEYLSGLPDATDEEGQPIPMGEEDRRVARVARERAKDEAAKQSKPAATIPPSFSTEIAETLARQGRDSDDLDYQRLCDGKRYPTQGAFLRELEGLGPKAGAVARPTANAERLAEAMQEWQEINRAHSNPNAPDAAAQRARKRELEAVIKGAEALGE